MKISGSRRADILIIAILISPFKYCNAGLCFGVYALNVATYHTPVYDPIMFELCMTIH